MILSSVILQSQSASSSMLAVLQLSEDSYRPSPLPAMPLPTCHHPSKLPADKVIQRNERGLGKRSTSRPKQPHFIT